MNSQAAKRYACDRCRAQKLKCSRSEPNINTKSPCERCLRLGALCFTGGGRPLGRPPLHAAASTAQSQGYDGMHDAGPGADHSLGVRTNGPAPSHYDARAAAGAEQLAHTASALWLAAASTPTAPTTYGDFAMASGSSQAPSFSEFNMADFELDELDELDDSDAHLGGGSSGGGRLRPSLGGSSNDHRASPAATASAGPDPAAFVAGLLGSILLQLTELKAQPWAGWDPRLTRAAFFHGSAPDPRGARDLALWNSALAVAMRFAMVLQWLGATYPHAPPPGTVGVAAGTAAESPLRRPSPSPPPPPPAGGLPTVLLLLSAYLQLGELFGVVLGRIGRCLEEEALVMRPPTSHLSRPSSAASWLGGPAGATTVQIALMLQTAEASLRTVERLMGLPGEERVWGGEAEGAGAVGVLYQENASEIVRAFVAQARPTFRALKHAHERIRAMLAEGAQRH